MKYIVKKLVTEYFLHVSVPFYCKFSKTSNNTGMKTLFNKISMETYFSSSTFCLLAGDNCLLIFSWAFLTSCCKHT